MRARPIAFCLGDRSPFVADVQEMLAGEGFDPGKQLGTVDVETERAVAAYQRARGLPPTGIIDCDTMEQLYGPDRFPAKLLRGAEGWEGTGWQAGVSRLQAGAGGPGARPGGGAARTIVISVGSRELGLYDGGRLVRKYPVAVGKPSTPTPVGLHQILEKIMFPGDVLGSRWMGFTPEMHGIHGTNRPELIGQAVSNGCVRMHNRDVEELYEMVDVGTPVAVIEGPVEMWPMLGSTQQKRPQPAAIGPAYPKDSPPNPGSRTYVVQPGDSLWLIAQRLGTTVELLAAANRISDPDLIYPGQILVVP